LAKQRVILHSRRPISARRVQLLLLLEHEHGGGRQRRLQHLQIEQVVVLGQRLGLLELGKQFGVSALVELEEGIKILQFQVEKFF
jgi:hypothetical protein